MKLSASFFFFVISSSLFSQPVIPHFETLSVDDGLSQSAVYAICQDKEGFMWFGTGDGLNRYDGNTIKTFKNKEMLSSTGNSNFIRGHLCEDPHGNIWFSTETGIYYFDKTKEVLKASWLFPKQKTGIVYYELVTIDSNENLWLFNNGLGFINQNNKLQHDYFNTCC